MYYQPDNPITVQDYSNEKLFQQEQLLMELLHHCRDYAQQYYADLLLEAEATLSNEFFEQAQQCRSNDEQQRYFEASQQLKNHSNTMRTVFKNQINQYYDCFSNGRDQQSTLAEKIDTTTLSLVDREALEDELAISVIVSKSNSRNSESLWKLNRRLAVLRGGKNVNDETNPFGPAKVCNALQVAVNKLELDNKARMLIYKHLGKIIVDQFGDILEALNSLLVNRGILPNLHFSVTHTNHSPFDQDSTETTATNNAALESAEHIAHQQQLYRAIQQLQSHTGPRTQTAGGISLQGLATGANNGADTFSAVDYALALSAIQQSQAFLSSTATNQSVAIDTAEEKLFSQLVKQANAQGRHKIAQDHANTVDLVGLIFRYMLDDPNLNDAVKSLLSHLHTPYLKLALMDNTFLNNYEHSARVLLNQMAEVGSRWIKDDNDRTVLPTIKKNVNTILREFIDDVSLFDEWLEQFLRFKDSIEKRAQMVEKRNTESQQGLERLELSRQRASDEVTSRLQQAQVSDNASQRLIKPWTDFLAFNLLRHGENSLSWKSALKVVDGVVWSVKPKEAIDSKEDFHRRQQSLEHSVTQGLETIGYDPQASKDLIHSLKEAHEQANIELTAKVQKEQHTQVKKPEEEQSADVKIPPPVIRPPNVKPKSNVSPKTTVKPKNMGSPMTKTEPKPPLSTTLSREEKHTLAMLKDIAFGTWFEFKQESAAIQLKLAWFSRISSHYMFVDQSGIKQLVETQQNLVRGMCAGTICIVNPNEKSFMERALEAVLDTLALKK